MLTWLPLLSYSKSRSAFSFHSISQTMPDHREELAGNLHMISSPSSTYQTHSRHGSEGDREFSFWSSSNTISIENDCDQLGDNEAKLNSETEFGEDFGLKKFRSEHSPFLPRSHHCCSLSDPSRSKAIAERRKELMEMIKDMPESSFELSFQDMVDEQQVQQPDQNETSVDNTLMHTSNKAQFKKLNKKKTTKNKSNRPGQILRVESMDSETFLLKMFFPTSLGWMKKVKVTNGSKVSKKPSFQESIKQVGKEWKIKRFFLAGDNRGVTGDGISQNTSSSSDKSRCVDRNFSFSLGCWPFFHYTKGKTKK